MTAKYIEYESHMWMFYSVKILTFGNFFKIFTWCQLTSNMHDLQRSRLTKLKYMLHVCQVKNVEKVTSILDFPKIRMFYAVKCLKFGLLFQNSWPYKHEAYTSIFLILTSGGHVCWRSVDIRSGILKKFPKVRIFTA